MRSLAPIIAYSKAALNHKIWRSALFSPSQTQFPIFFFPIFFEKKSCHPEENGYNEPASPSGGAGQHRGCSSVVERNLAKVDVVGSSPIIRLRKKGEARRVSPFLRT